MGKPASFRPVVKLKSSETLPTQRSRILSFSNTDRLIAVEPPQQKFFILSRPNADATEAFQTERSREDKPPFLDTNQRYPLEAPSLSSTSGLTSCLNQTLLGRASVSTKTNTSAS